MMFKVAVELIEWIEKYMQSMKKCIKGQREKRKTKNQTINERLNLKMKRNLENYLELFIASESAITTQDRHGV